MLSDSLPHRILNVLDYLEDPNTKTRWDTSNRCKTCAMKITKRFPTSSKNISGGHVSIMHHCCPLYCCISIPSRFRRNTKLEKDTRDNLEWLQGTAFNTYRIYFLLSPCFQPCHWSDSCGCKTFWRIAHPAMKDKHYACWWSDNQTAAPSHAVAWFTRWQ